MPFLAIIASSDGSIGCFMVVIAVVVFSVLFGSGDSSGATAGCRAPSVSVPDFMVKTESGTIGSGSDEEPCVRVYCQGRVPVSFPQDISVLVTLQDMGDSQSRSVIVTIPQFQDKDSSHYRDSADLGRFESGTYLNQWACVGIVPTAHLVAPYGGRRQLKASCFCVPATLIKLPLSDSRLWQGVVCAAEATIAVNLPMTGYLEFSEKNREAKAVVVELAMACAGADGSLDQRELRTVQRWMRSTIESFGSDDKDDQEKMRAALNEAFKRAAAGSVDVAAACVRLKKLAMPAVSQSALALCVDVIAADGELHPGELSTVRTIAVGLGLDYDKLQTLMDKQFVKSVISTAQDNLEALVGIDLSWDKERIRKHLAVQFLKWNSRAPSAKTVEDQARIRLMLEAVAKLRKKYS